MEDQETLFESYYKANTDTGIVSDEEGYIITKSMDAGISPELVKYGIMNGVFRGTVVADDQNLYYFTSRPGESFKLVKAENEYQLYEANRILEKSKLVIKLIKSKEDEVDPNEEKRAALDSGASQGSGAPTPLLEQEAINQQTTLMTEDHPGAAGSSTPDDPNVGRDWHSEDAQKGWTFTDLLRGLGQELQKSIPAAYAPPSEKEVQYMIQVLGHKSQDIINKNMKIAPSQLPQYNQWLAKSVRANTSPLQNWLKKNG